MTGCELAHYGVKGMKWGVRKRARYTKEREVLRGEAKRLSTSSEGDPRRNAAMARARYGQADARKRAIDRIETSRDLGRGTRDAMLSVSKDDVRYHDRYARKMYKLDRRTSKLEKRIGKDARVSDKDAKKMRKYLQKSSKYAEQLAKSREGIQNRERFVAAHQSFFDGLATGTRIQSAAYVGFHVLAGAAAIATMGGVPLLHSDE